MSRPPGQPSLGGIVPFKRKTLKAFHRGMGLGSQGALRDMEARYDSLPKSSLQPRAEGVLL